PGGLGSLGEVDARVVEQRAQGLERERIAAAPERPDGRASDPGVLVAAATDWTGDLRERADGLLLASASLGDPNQRGLADLGPRVGLAPREPGVIGRERGEAVAKLGEARGL